MKRSILTLIAAVLFCSGAHATAVLELVPADGIVSGTPGSTVQWNVTITNDSYYAVLTGAEFPAGAGLGTFENFAALDLIVVGTQAPYSGIARFTIGAGVAPGTVITGPINVYYTVYPVDISQLTEQDPFPDPLVEEALAWTGATVNVDAVPEPCTLVLLAGALAWLGRKKTGRTS